MARKFTIELIMNLAKSIGANPAKLSGTRSNISFLGKGPTKNPLFQNYLAGLENASKENLGDPKKLFGAIEDAVGWAKDGKLNSIQTEILGHNLSGIEKVLHPPVLPTASVTAIRSGIKTAAPKPRSDIDRLLQEGYTDTRGRRWDFPKAPGPGIDDIKTGEQLYTGKAFSKLPEPGALLNQKTGMSRAIARQILQQDTRLKLKPEELFMLKEGKGEPLDLMRKYYGKSMMNLDEFLNDAAFRGFISADEVAATALKEIELIPQFASGGLARILDI